LNHLEPCGQASLKSSGTEGDGRWPGALSCPVFTALPPADPMSLMLSTRRWSLAVVLMAASLLGCAGAVGPSAATLTPADVEDGLRGATAIDRPYRVVFQWEYQEPGARFRGEGVARMEPPYRGRLDLFASSGDRLSTAILVGDALWVIEGAAVQVPPAMMLWAALGVFHPTAGFRATEARRLGAAEVELRYQGQGDETLVLGIQGNRLMRLDRQGAGRREELRLQFASPDRRFPREALYRDHTAVRELRLRLEQEEAVEAFPSHVWIPDA